MKDKYSTQLINSSSSSSLKGIDRFRHTFQPSSPNGGMSAEAPSYAEPTEKVRNNHGEVNRIKISRALETMRKAHIKDSLVKNQNVTEPC